MKLIQTLSFYEDCTKALYECFGDEEASIMHLKYRGYNGYSEDTLKKSVESVRESRLWGIKNFLSKNFGGSLTKIDRICKDMKKVDLQYVKNEHDHELEYIQVFIEFYKKKVTGERSEILSQMNTRLEEIEISTKNLTNNYFKDIHALENKIDDIVDGNSRRADYYNLRRAQDVAEVKEQRAELKFKVAKYRSTPEISSEIDRIFGSVKDAREDSENAKSELEAVQTNVASYNIADTATFQTTAGKMYERNLIIYQTQVLRKIQKVQNMLDKGDSIADEDDYNEKKKEFDAYYKNLLIDIDKKIENARNIDSRKNTKLHAAKIKCLENMDKFKNIVADMVFPEFEGNIKSGK